MLMGECEDVKRLVGTDEVTSLSLVPRDSRLEDLGHRHRPGTACCSMHVATPCRHVAVEASETWRTMVMRALGSHTKTSTSEQAATQDTAVHLHLHVSPPSLYASTPSKGPCSQSG